MFAHISRAISPCRALTPLAYAAKRSASTVMLKRSPQGVSHFAKFMNPVRSNPICPQKEAKNLSIISSGKASLPAATGVCVVNTELEATTCCAWKKLKCFCWTNSRTRSRLRNAAWPSFMWKTVGEMPSARSARTPPIPSTTSWAMRISWSPPYSLAANSRSLGAFCTTSVSSRKMGMRPT